MENLIDTKQMTATVTGIHWERIFLHLDVRIDSVDLGNNASDLEFYFVRKGKKRYVASARAKVMEQKDNCYHLKLNITNQGEKKCLPSGTYSLIVCQNENIMAKAVVDRELVSSMSNCSRNFLYRGKKCVYTVSFFVTEGEEDLPFTMRAMPSAETRTGFRKYKRSRKFSFKKAKAFLHPIKKLKKWYHKNHRKIKVKIYRHYLRKYKNMNNVVLFMSEQSETIGSNEKAVMDRMIARGLDKEWTILESYRSSVSKPKLGFKSWVATLKKMAMSTVIVLDDHAPVLDWLKLDEKTKVIQLWHAGAGFKSSGYSRWGHDGCPAPQSCHRQYQYGIAGSKSIAPFFSEVWGINDSRVLPTGMPRIDEYLDKDYREAKTKELYETYPMAKGKKVILFAPTYRGRNKATAHYPYELIDFDRLYELCGEEYVVFFKMHPWVAEPVPVEQQYADRFLDVGRYPNINDLFYITDLLITDYSSNIFEFSLMRKPMLFFAFDKIQYSFSRGFHRDYEEAAPGKVCYTFAEILDAIEQKDFEYEKVEEYVEKHFDYIDSNASDRVIDWLILGNIPENIQAEIDEEEAFVAKMHELDLSSLKKSKKDELDGEDSEDGADDDDADEDDAEAATEENHDSDGE